MSAARIFGSWIVAVALAFSAAASNAATLSASPTPVPIGTPAITAAWSGIGSPTGADWIAVYVPGAPDGSYLGWRYTTGAASGSVSFSISSLSIGTYELRLFANNGYTKLATSNTFSVTGANLSVSPSLAVPGASVSAQWSGILSPTATDWVGLYTPGAPNNPAISWRYTTGTASGSVPFTVPPSVALGNYELRLFSNNGYTRLGTSNALAIGPTVSGTVTLDGSPLASVTLVGTNGASCGTSNASGVYSCTVPPGWSGSVTPSLAGQVFTPASRSYTNVTAAQTAQGYTAVPAFYQVNGSVTLNGVALANVAMTATGGPTCSSTNGAGQYSCTVPLNWSGSVTPSASGYSFGPASRTYTSVSSPQTAQTFTATLDTATAPLYFVHVDHLDTPRLVADATGTSVWKWDQQEPFGVSPPDTNPSALGVFQFPLRFPGQYDDSETGLFYNYFRDCYDPVLGRYCQSDPIGLDGGLNTFAYVHGNPISYTDPLGLWSFQFGGYSGGPYGPGPGVTLTFGTNPNGTGFMTLNFGFGWGGGFKFDPLGQMPGYDPCLGTGWGMGYGLSAAANFNFFPIYGQTGAGLGRNITSAGSSGYGYLTKPSAGVRGGSWGINATANAGGQITIFGGGNPK